MTVLYFYHAIMLFVPVDRCHFDQREKSHFITTDPNDSLLNAMSFLFAGVDSEPRRGSEITLIAL